MRSVLVPVVNVAGREHSSSSNGLINARYCRYNDELLMMGEISPETCWAGDRLIWTVCCCILLDNYCHIIRCTVHWHKILSVQFFSSYPAPTVATFPWKEVHNDAPCAFFFFVVVMWRHDIVRSLKWAWGGKKHFIWGSIDSSFTPRAVILLWPFWPSWWLQKQHTGDRKKRVRSAGVC